VRAQKNSWKSQLQFVLPITWSYGKKYGVTLEQVTSWWSDRPSKLAGLHSKVRYYKKKRSFSILFFVHTQHTGII